MLIGVTYGRILGYEPSGVQSLLILYVLELDIRFTPMPGFFLDIGL